MYPVSSIEAEARKKELLLSSDYVVSQPTLAGLGGYVLIHCRGEFELMVLQGI